jgi:hypothetical protein
LWKNRDCVIVITESPHYGRQQSRRGLGDTDGLAFVSHAGAVFSGRHPLGIETENSC